MMGLFSLYVYIVLIVMRYFMFKVLTNKILLITIKTQKKQRRHCFSSWFFIHSTELANRIYNLANNRINKEETTTTTQEENRYRLK